MSVTETRKRRFVRLRARGWVAFASGLATIAAVAVALFFWANGSAIGAVIAAVVAVVCAVITVSLVRSNRRDIPDPALGSRMARLRRARYRSAYPRKNV